MDISIHQNLFELLQLHAQKSTDSPKLFWQDHSFTWAQVEEGARRVAAGLKDLGVQQGDRVALMLPNTPPYLFIQAGVHLLGATLVPIHILTRGPELGYLLDDSEAKVLIYWNGFQEVAEEAAIQTESLRHRIEIGGEPTEGILDFHTWMLEHAPLMDAPVGGGNDPALIRYTAGVTGRPKGAMISHTNVLYSSRATLKALRVRPIERVLGAIPFYHPFGCTLQYYMVLRSGASLYLQTRFDPQETQELIQAGTVNAMIGLPSHYSGLLEAMGSEEEDAGKLLFAVSGGGPLDILTRRKLEQRFSTRIATVYGTCETSPTIAVNPSHIEETPAESFGRPISDTEVRIVDEENDEVGVDEVGEIVVRGPGVFQGYWNRPDATNLTIDEEGWFHTSDLGRIDMDGFLYGVGRLHDRINKGGFSVYPREVEGVLNAHPSIYASGVIGVPDPRLGEEIVAYVVPRGGAPILENEIIEYCTERLARFKTPQQIITIDQLPRSPGGSVLRRALREHWQENLSQSTGTGTGTTTPKPIPMPEERNYSTPVPVPDSGASDSLIELVPMEKVDKDDEE